MNERLDIHAWVDGELDDIAHARIDEWASNDPATKAEAESISALKSNLKTHCSAGIPNPDLWKTCQTRLNDLDRLKRADNVIGRYAWGICGAFVLLIAGAAVFNRSSGSQTLYTGDMARMSQSLLPVQLPSSRTTEPEHKIQGFQGAMIMFDSRLSVLGMAAGVVNGRRAARLTLADSQGNMALLVVEDISRVEGTEGSSGTPFSRGKIDDANCVSWTDKGCGLILAGNRDSIALEEIARLIRIQR